MIDSKYSRLLEERKRIEAELLELEKEGRLNAINEIKEHIETMNIQPHELFSEAQLKAKVPAEPLFKNPNNAKETWTGRGRSPTWVDEYIASGKDIADCLINNTEAGRKKAKVLMTPKTTVVAAPESNT